MKNLREKSSLYQANKNSIQLWLLIVSCGIIFCGNLPIYAQKTKITLDNFKIDFSQIKDSPQIDKVTKAVQRQIEIVERVKLSEEDLNFFRSIPVIMIPENAGTPGVYSFNKKTVFLKARDLAPDRPILLHELLHAYHHLKLKDGMQNRQILTFYEQAKEKYPDYLNEYFLSDAKEFFAVTASIYLFGDIPRPPFNSSAIKKAQPNYYQYLKTLF